MIFAYFVWINFFHVIIGPETFDFNLDNKYGQNKGEIRKIRRKSENKEKSIQGHFVIKKVFLAFHSLYLHFFYLTPYLYSPFEISN